MEELQVFLCGGVMKNTGKKDKWIEASIPEQREFGHAFTWLAPPEPKFYNRYLKALAISVH